MCEVLKACRPSRPRGLRSLLRMAKPDSLANAISAEPVAEVFLRSNVLTWIAKRYEMTSKKSKSLLLGAREAAIELVKQLIPFSGVFIESLRKYHESIQEQQREKFVEALSKRISELEQNADWYKSASGEDFVKKVIASALNAEYADKIDLLAQALVNGPTLGADDAKRSKFVEMIRQISKPAIDVLVASLEHPTSTGKVMAGELANALGWSPEMVDSCVRELYSLGAYSSTKSWYRDGESYGKSEYFEEGIPVVTDLTRSFAEFVT